MRASALALAAVLMLAATATPAQAAWESYVSHKLGFAFEAPGTISAEIGASPRGTIVGTKEQMVFRTAENDIEYSVAVTNFAQAQEMSETILGEALDMFQGVKPVLTDTFSRVGTGRDMIYGRKSTVELPGEGGQATTAFYFANGYLYQLTATVLPANGDYSSPDPQRFIDSIRFDLTAANPNAVELELPEF